MKQIAIVGSGGFGREVACLINIINRSGAEEWEFIGFFDDVYPKGIRGIIGNTDDLNRWNTPLDVVIAIGQTGALKKYATKLTNPNLRFPNIISPDVGCYDTDSLRMGKGNIVALKCFISCQVEIGDFNIFNCNISIGHDARIGSYNALMPFTAISGNVTVGDENFFGVGATVLQKATVGNQVRLGAGSVLLKKAKDRNLYMGTPATIVKF